MQKKRTQFFKDLLIMVISIAFAVYLARTNTLHNVVEALDGLSYLGVFLAGMFFTSIFTTAPAIVVLGELSLVTPLPVLALLGGLGAMCGDYLIFKFVKDRVSKDMDYLFSLSKKHRIPHIFKSSIFKFLVPFLGAVILASPLPDELGVAMMGLSKLNSRTFLFVSFIFNTIGVFIIGLLAHSLF